MVTTWLHRDLYTNSTIGILPLPIHRGINSLYVYIYIYINIYRTIISYEHFLRSRKMASFCKLFSMMDGLDSFVLILGMIGAGSKQNAAAMSPWHFSAVRKKEGFQFGSTSKSGQIRIQLGVLKCFENWRKTHTPEHL